MVEFMSKKSTQRVPSLELYNILIEQINHTLWCSKYVNTILKVFLQRLRPPFDEQPKNLVLDFALLT